jgi:hypothetical protein
MIAKEDQPNYKMLIIGVLCLAWITIATIAVNRSTEQIKSIHANAVLIHKSKTDRYISREVDGTIILITPTFSGGQEIDTLFKGIYK